MTCSDVTLRLIDGIVMALFLQHPLVVFLGFMQTPVKFGVRSL